MTGERHTRKSTGESGELIARRYLEARGYAILATNWRCKEGEIDIVARHGEGYVFVEVKTRHGGDSGEAFAAITGAKRARMVAAAYAYVAQAGLEDDVPWRIDAAAVIFGRDGLARVAYVEDALGW